MLLLLIVIAYLETGFKFSKVPVTTTILSTSTTSTTTSTSSTVNATYLLPCNDFSLELQSFNSVISGNCLSSGGMLGLWVAGGDSGRETTVIRGADNRTYVNQSSSYECTTFYQNFTAPAQAYEVTLRAGAGGGSCGYALARLNTSTTPPIIIYNNIVYNGDFGSGRYNGWYLTNPGFGSAPLNITYADSHECYLNHTWSNYEGTFFATTYNCGLSVAAGNLTSNLFYVSASKPFLNFKIISPEHSGLYVEILQNNTPKIIAHYNTFNISFGAQGVSTFRNASISLSTFANKAVQIRVVSNLTSGRGAFIAVGDFALSNKPVQDQGILTSINITG